MRGESAGLVLLVLDRSDDVHARSLCPRPASTSMAPEPSHPLARSGHQRQSLAPKSQTPKSLNHGSGVIENGVLTWSGGKPNDAFPLVVTRALAFAARGHRTHHTHSSTHPEAEAVAHPSCAGTQASYATLKAEPSCIACSVVLHLAHAAHGLGLEAAVPAAVARVVPVPLLGLELLEVLLFLQRLRCDLRLRASRVHVRLPGLVGMVLVSAAVKEEDGMVWRRMREGWEEGGEEKRREDEEERKEEVG
eukprot:2850262-Rhodomonas_salina.1